MNDNASHARRGQRIRNETCRIFRPVHDVDLLATELCHDRTNTRAHRADARALGIHAFASSNHGNLGAVTGFAGNGLDPDESLLNFGNLTLEKPLNQSGVGAREGNTSTAVGTLDGNDQCAQAGSVRVVLSGDLL